MSKSKSLLISVLFFLSAFGAVAQNSTELFTQGTQAYLSKDYKKAQELFKQSLDLDPHNSTIITNLALTEYQLGQKPMAIGLLRKALALDPEVATAQDGLRFILSEHVIKDIPRNLNSYETLRTQMLQPVPLPAYLVLSVLSFLCAGWTLISYLGRRRKALEEEKALPPFPLVPSILVIIFLVCSGLVLLKLYESTVLRGTIVTETVPLQTAPGENQVAIMDLPGGVEVQVRADQGDWVQVTYPGSATGWIKKSAILMTR